MNLFKRLWHLFCDYRCTEWYTWRAASVWLQWHPRIHFGFAFDISLNLGHKAVDDADLSWGPEFSLQLGIPWLDFALDIPNATNKAIFPDDEE